MVVLLPVFALTCLPASAQESAADADGQPPEPADVEAARERGELIATSGGPGGVSSACVTCHGADGSGDAVAGFPRLSGLGPHYLAKQLDDYANGTRPNDIMTPIAEALSAQDREDVSLYYAALKTESDSWQRSEIDPQLLQRGGVLYAMGSEADDIQACGNCHGPQGEGLPPSYPELAGQHGSYVSAQMQLFKSGTRRNDPGEVMQIIAGNMSDEDIEAVAAYLADLEP